MNYQLLELIQSLSGSYVIQVEQYLYTCNKGEHSGIFALVILNQTCNQNHALSLIEIY